MRRTFVAFAVSLPLVTTASRLVDRFWAVLAPLWGSRAAPRLLPKEGCGMDPDGRSQPAVLQPRPDAGYGADPNGGCSTKL